MSDRSDTPDFAHFHDAQAHQLDAALAELRAGRKRGHWVWFVFPQLAALGRSGTAKRFGLRDLDHARDYLADPRLAANLDAAFAAMLRNRGADPVAVLGAVDAMKLRSCATLFREAGSDAARAVLNAFYGGEPDAETLRLL